MAKNAKRLMAAFHKEHGKSGDEMTAFVRASVSKSAAGLYKWGYATDMYYEIFKEVEPKKKKAAEMQEQMNKSEADLKKIEDQLAILNEQLAQLNSERTI